jgi:hypothetical protein
VADPTQRGQFVRELLAATVLVVGDPGAASPQGANPQGGGLAVKWGVMPNGRPCIPFYSSAEWLAGVVQRQVPVLRLPARTLFEGTRGSTLALNLGSPLAKKFTPGKITNLLGGGEGEGDLKDAMYDASSASDAGDDSNSLVDFVVVTPDADGIASWLYKNGRKFYEA